MDDFNEKFQRRMARLEGKIRFCSGDEVSEESLASFYRQMYPDRASFLTKHWRWLYRVGLQSQIKSPLLAVAEDRVVGHGGLISVTLQRAEEQREAVWMMDFGILPEYQRGMLGGSFVQLGASKCSLRVAFLNERSWGMVSKLGWKTHFLSTAFQLPLRPEKLPRVQTVTNRWTGGAAVSKLGGLAIRAIGRALTLITSRPELLPASSENLKPFTQARNHGDRKSVV